MDQKAKDAQLDEVQWGEAVAKVNRDKREVWDKVKGITFLHTIEPYKMYLRLESDDDDIRLWEATGLTEEGKIEFPKCEILAETDFKRDPDAA